MDWENVINPAVQQDITSAAQTASPALRERTPKAVRPPPVPAAALCTPARAAIPAPAVRQREHAPDLIRDHLPQAEAEVVQAAQHIKQMSEHAAPIQPHTPAVFLMISEGRAPTVLNVQEDCALRAILLPDNT